MKILNWQKGRQKGLNYFKLKLWSFKIGKKGFDAFLLKYPEPGILPTHVDKIKGKHYRCNLTLWGKSIFKCGEMIKDFYLLKIFRPDINPHSLQILSKTLKLSIGYAKLNDNENSNISKRSVTFIPRYFLNKVYSEMNRRERRAYCRWLDKYGVIDNSIKY